MSKRAAQKWLKQALHDLEMSQKNLDIGGYDVAAFLAHQAIEKLLKALLILKGQRPPKSHYLDELGRMLGLDETVIIGFSDLSIDYFFSRYPDVSDDIPFEQYSEDSAISKVETARELFRNLEPEYRSLLETNGT